MHSDTQERFTKLSKTDGKSMSIKHDAPDVATLQETYVWVTSHTLSSRRKRHTSKFASRRDGPYIVLSVKGPVSYFLVDRQEPTVGIGTYHTSNVSPYNEPEGYAPTPSFSSHPTPRTIKKGHSPGTFTGPEGEIVSIDFQGRASGAAGRRLPS